MNASNMNFYGSVGNAVATNQGGINYYAQQENESQAEKQLKILILAANPEETNVLKLPREIRNLTEIIKKSLNRDRFILETRLAVRPQDLQTALLEVKPRIVHFCGHGEGERGLVLENNLGQLHFVSTEALADLFRHFSRQTECVLLNACYTQVQAEEIVRHINFVVGMRQPILDSSAIAFSEGFYGALGAGESITKAYDFGRNRIYLELTDPSSQRNASRREELGDRPVPEHLIPILFTKKNPIEIEQISAIKIESAAKGNAISFSNNTSIGGDVVEGDRSNHSINNQF